VSLEEGLAKRLNVERALVPVENTRTVTKKSLIHNDATPNIEVDAETYEVRADGELLTCQPAKVLPMAQRYFLF
jgi:urease subunit alpha